MTASGFNIIPCYEIDSFSLFYKSPGSKLNYSVYKYSSYRATLYYSIPPYELALNGYGIPIILTIAAGILAKKCCECGIFTY